MNVADELLKRCEETIGYRFKDRNLLKQALTHSSSANVRFESNERLEFLGDAALGFVVAHMLYRLFPRCCEGELSQLKGEIVSRKTCRRIAAQLGLDAYLILGKGVEGVPSSLVSNVMEAVIGAIFLDGGFEEAQRFIEKHFQADFEERMTAAHEINASDDSQTDALRFCRNFKSILQSQTQRLTPPQIPEYCLIAEQGPPHRRQFKVAVKLNDRIFQAAWGASKKEAEQRAAQNALHQLSGREALNPDL